MTHPMPETLFELRMAVLQSQSVYAELEGRIKELEEELKHVSAAYGRHAENKL